MPRSNASWGPAASTRPKWAPSGAAQALLQESG
jgi:hypothetical protein